MNIRKVVVVLIVLDWGMLGRSPGKMDGFYFTSKTHLLDYNPGWVKEATPPQSHSWLPQGEQFYEI